MVSVRTDRACVGTLQVRGKLQTWRDVPRRAVGKKWHPSGVVAADHEVKTPEGDQGEGATIRERTHRKPKC